MNDKTQVLLSLIKENPDLPVVPMVNYDVVEDGYGRWMGSVGDCFVGEYACYRDRFYDERKEFEEAYYYDNDEELCKMFNYHPQLDGVSVEVEKTLDEYLHTVSDKYFNKAIIVNIDLPGVIQNDRIRCN